jgi:hypothetical protein
MPGGLGKGDAMLYSEGPRAREHERSRRLVVVLTVLVLAAAVWLAACGGSSGSASSSDSGGGAAATPATPAAAVDYATLLTQDDVRAITGIKDATPMPESDWHQREGTSKYFAIYQGKKSPEALWIRVGGAGMFEEQRSASNMKPVAVSGLGDEAFWWDWTDMQKGIAVKVGNDAYLISTKFLWEKPQLSDAQLQEVAKTIVGRL